MTLSVLRATFTLLIIFALACGDDSGYRAPEARAAKAAQAARLGTAARAEGPLVKAAPAEPAPAARAEPAREA
jgi:hypothetical protein